MLEAGVHPKLVQDLLGHSTVAVTLNTYSHVTSGLSREVARTIDRIFGATGRTSDIAVLTSMHPMTVKQVLSSTAARCSSMTTHGSGP